MQAKHNACLLQPMPVILLNTSDPRGNHSATSNNMKLVHWPLMGGLLHLVGLQRGGDWAGPQPVQSPPRCTKYNSPPINGQCTKFILFDVHYDCLWDLRRRFESRRSLKSKLQQENKNTFYGRRVSVPLSKFYEKFLPRAKLLGIHHYTSLHENFRIGSSRVVVECQRHFNFLPIKVQLIVRTAKFLQSFTASVKTLCLLFERQALNQLRCIYSAYGKVRSACQLRNCM